MPLTTRERIGSRTLLQSLDTADLFSLAGTVTKKKSTACTRAEAIETILQNSLSAYELLNRRKILRDIIAAYLKKEGVPIPSKITKAEVILKTLAHWSESGSCIPGNSSSLTQKQKVNSPERFGWFDYDLYNTWAIGLSAQERVGCRKVLKSLDVLAIASLAGTISKKKSRACTSAEKIDIILEKSKSAYELLNRKKVIRDAIAAYLKNEGVPISSNMTKAEVVQKALVYWNELDSCTPPSVMQPQKASSDFSYPFYFHTKSAIRSPLEDATKTKILEAQTPDLHIVPHKTTCSEFQIKQQPEAKTEKVKSIPYTGVKGCAPTQSALIRQRRRRQRNKTLSQVE